MADENFDEKAVAAAIERMLNAAAEKNGLELITQDAEGVKVVVVAGDMLFASDYVDDRDEFIEKHTKRGDEKAQSLGRGHFMNFMFDAVRDFICDNPEAAKKVEEALKDAKSQNVTIGTPTAAGISVSGATLVAAAIASVLSPALAALASPVLAAIALVIFLSGFRAFCKWSTPADTPSPSAPPTQPG